MVASSISHHGSCRRRRLHTKHRCSRIHCCGNRHSSQHRRSSGGSGSCRTCRNMTDATRAAAPISLQARPPAGCPVCILSRPPVLSSWKRVRHPGTHSQLLLLQPQSGKQGPLLMPLSLLAISESDFDNSREPGPQAKGLNHLETPLRQLRIPHKASSCAKRGGHLQLRSNPRGARGIGPETFRNKGSAFILSSDPWTSGVSVSAL